MTQTGYQTLIPQAIDGFEENKTAERKCWNSCKSTSRNSRMMLEPSISINPLKHTPSLIANQTNKNKSPNHRREHQTTNTQTQRQRQRQRQRKNHQVVGLASLQVSSFLAPKHHFLPSSLLRGKLIPGPCFPTLLPCAFHRRENVLGIRNHSW